MDLLRKDENYLVKNICRLRSGGCKILK